MTSVVDSLRTNIRERQAQIDTVRRSQVTRGTLCNHQGLIKGVSLNSRGNRAYTRIGGVGVRNAWIRNPVGTFQPGTGVALEYDQELRRYYVTGLDAEAHYAAGATSQKFNPVSGDNLYMDSGFILDFFSQPVLAVGTSTNVEIKPGILYYYDGGTLKRYEYDGDKVSLAAYAASSGNHSILQIWLDPFNAQLKYTQSTEQATTTPFDNTDWDETLTGAGNWLPLQSYKMTDTSATSITQGNKLRDNRPIYTLPAGGGGDTNVINSTTAERRTETVLWDLTLGSTANFDTDNTPDDGSASPDFSGYDSLRFELMGRTDRANNGDNIRMFFNNDTTNANYRNANIPASIDSDNSVIAIVSAASSEANAFSMVTGQILGATDTNVRTNIVASTAARRSATDMNAYGYAVDWEDTSAVTRIQVQADLGTGFVANSRLVIVGVKEETVVTSVSGVVNLGDTVNRIVTDANGAVVVDANGNVVIGA